MVVVLAVAKDMPLERLVDLVDRIAEYSTLSVVAMSTCTSRVATTEAAAPSDDKAARFSRLEKAIRNLRCLVLGGPPLIGNKAPVGILQLWRHWTPAAVGITTPSDQQPASAPRCVRGRET